MKIEFTQNELIQIYTALSYLKVRNEKDLHNDSTHCYHHVIFDKSNFENLDPDESDIHELIRKIYFRINDEKKLDKIDDDMEKCKNELDELNAICPDDEEE